MMKETPTRRIIASAVLAGFMTISTACYGPFNLTRNVYHWNSGVKGSGEVNDKWMKEFVFFGMIVIPVYMFSTLLDAFIFNSIQFWSGDNPVKASELEDDGRAKVAQVGDLILRWTPTSEGAIVTYERHGIIERRAMIMPSANGYRLLDEGGGTLAEAEYAADGGLTVLDHDCHVVQRLTADLLRSMVQSHGPSRGESVALISIK